ncbi:ash family protein [Enterobacter cloacae]|nr:ash family protein [Enterobacter cloacae]MCD1393525.1 ash family protein [Enterobacter cloacae]TOZ45366.1 hypothetical protein DK925_15365 [Enterobacter cloacae]HAV2176790.1 ash family protein [Enterobacter cloacae]HBL8182671.1 ash family protein [Enterobacter cloacae]
MLRRASGYIPMVGWAGASQDAPVSIKAGNANSVQSCHPGNWHFSGSVLITYWKLSYDQQ